MLFDDFEIPSDDTIVWRYMDLAQFISLLSTESLYFCTASKMKGLDPFEGYLTQRMYKEYLNSLYNLNPIEEIKLKIEKILKDTIIPKFEKADECFRSSIGLNCWHENKDESDAMWKIYGKSNVAIAIQSTVSSLKNCFGMNDNISIHKIKYENLDEVKLPYEFINSFLKDIFDYGKSNTYEEKQSYFFKIREQIIKQLLYKRKCFEHEREIRIFSYFKPFIPQKLTEQELEQEIQKFPEELRPMARCLNSMEQDPPEFLRCIEYSYIPVDLNILIDKIYLSPTMKDYEKQVVKSILSKYNVDKEVVISNIYKTPKLNYNPSVGKILKELEIF